MTQLAASSGLIGLIADSHGHKSSMSRCIDRLTSYGVEIIIHLGDFFDSQYSEDVMGILEIIQQNQILAVKGNNDYQVEKSMMNGCSHHIPAIDRQKVLSFLASVPMKRVIGDICFTHSLPYDSIRSFYEPMDTGNTDRAKQVFLHTPYRIVFCGHSHSPVLFRMRPDQTTRENIKRSGPTTLYQNERFIIIVGSAEESECGFFDISKMEYERIRI